jgi:hypothetical protein
VQESLKNQRSQVKLDVDAQNAQDWKIKISENKKPTAHRPSAFARGFGKFKKPEGQ